MTEREIFAAALEVPDPHMRAVFVQSACGGDSVLRKNVETLLRSHDEADSFLERSPLLPPDTIGSIPSTGPAEAAATLPPDTLAAEAASASEALHLLTPSQRPGSLGGIDHYEVQAVIGRGAMGIVYQAHDPRLNRVVAVKVLAPEFAAHPTARKRFLREAQAAAAVSHPHVVTIYAVDEGRPRSHGALPGSPTGAPLPYLVMEYVAGQTLHDKIEREGPLPLNALLRIGAQIASGLAAAHQQGLIHRDVKPANVLLENGVERVKLTDFGLARAVDDVGMTRTGEVAGTPQFMSPEQAQGAAVDHRSDLFSLGSVLYMMCTGRPPFRGETVVSVLRRVCDEHPRPIRELNADVPEWLAAIVHRLLAKDPRERFQSAQEVADLLSEHLARLQLPAGAVRPLPAVAAPGRSRARRRWLTAAAILALATLTLGTTEATGVTQFTAAVIRVVRGDGTLVITVDDPAVSVTIDGEDVVITGAGPKEIRVPAGSHRVTFAKEGRPIEQKLVTVTRGGREIVAATFLASPTPQPPRRLTRHDTDALAEELMRLYPLAQIGLAVDNDRLMVTGQPRDDAEVRAIIHWVHSKLRERGVAVSDSDAAGEPMSAAEGLTIVNELRTLTTPQRRRPSIEGSRLPLVGWRVGYGQRVGWSPDGTELLFTLEDNWNVFAKNIRTATSRRVLHVQPGDPRVADAVWSPDARRIAYVQRVPETPDEIWVVDADGQNPRRLAAGEYPCWGKVSHRLYFTSRTTNTLMSVEVDQPERPPIDHRVPVGYYPVVSPDEQFVASPTANELRIQRLEDGALVDVWRAPVSINGMLAEWSADSRYLSLSGYTDHHIALWVYDTQTRTTQELRCENVKRLAWSPDGRRAAVETTAGIWLVHVGVPEVTLSVLEFALQPDGCNR